MNRLPLLLKVAAETNTVKIINPPANRSGLLLDPILEVRSIILILLSDFAFVCIIINCYWTIILIIVTTVSMASHNATAGNNTIQVIKGLATAQIGIDKNMTGNELQKAMNLIVCMPATMKQMSEKQNMTGSMKDGMLMK
jgi:hypothetical protein